jgi:hypothetical protein
MRPGFFYFTEASMPDIERIQQLHAAARGQDKAELTVLHNAVLTGMNAYAERGEAGRLKDWQAAKNALADAVDRLWVKYFPGESGRSGGDESWFRDKRVAHEWYVTQGGILTYSGFTRQAFTVDGRKVSRMSVQKLLLDERGKKYTAESTNTDLSARREDADTRKAEADAAKAEMQAEEMRRAQDARWVLREVAEEETCVWVSRLRDAVAYHIGKNQLAIIHACGGNPARLSEVQSIIDAALANACNEIANSAEVTVEIEDLEEVGCT